MLERQQYAAMVPGGPAAVLGHGGPRVVSDPAFDDAGLSAERLPALVS